MSPNVSPDLNVLSQGLSFEFQHGNETIACRVTLEVVQDLWRYHRLSFTREEILGVLLPELDRLAAAKFRAGRFEENGEILIREADLLRYGFHRAA